MKRRRNESLANLIFVLLFIAVASIACTRIRGLGIFNKQSEKVNKFNYDIPFGFKSAEIDSKINKESAFIIVLPDSDQIMLRSVESEPIDLQTLGENVKEFVANKPEEERIAYIAATYEVTTAALVDVLNELRECEVNRVKLLISSAERRSDPYGNKGTYHKSMGDIPGPDRVIEVRIGKQTASDSPMPLPMPLPPPVSKGVRTISGGVLNGKAISLPKPEYPPAARAVRAAGPVSVQVLIDESGRVVSASAASGHPLLQAAAVLAARSARFEPTLLSGERVKVSGVIVYNFVL